MFPSLNNILGFIGFALVLVAVPGPSVMFALGRTISSGLKVGLTTVFFNSLGILVWMFVVAFGLGGLVQSQPVAINAIRLLGAVYLFYIGAKSIVSSRKAQKLLSPTSTDEVVPTASLKFSRIAREGFTVGLTNPKLAVFFCAVLPQFVDSAEFATAQMLVLGLIFFVIGAGGDSCYVLTAGLVRSWFVAKPGRAGTVQQLGGVLICILAVILLIDGLPHIFM